MPSRVSGEAARAMLDAGCALLNGGYVEVRTGSQPAGGTDTAATGTLLGTITLPNPAFGGAFDLDPDHASKGTTGIAAADVNAVTEVKAVAVGHAGLCRAYHSADAASWDGSMGGSSEG